MAKKDTDIYSRTDDLSSSEKELIAIGEKRTRKVMTFGERLKDMVHNIGYNLGINSQKYSNTFLNKQKDNKALDKNIKRVAKKRMTFFEKLQDLKHNLKYRKEKIKVSVSNLRESVGNKFADGEYRLKRNIKKLDPSKSNDSPDPKYRHVNDAGTPTMDKKSDIRQKKEQMIREVISQEKAKNTYGIICNNNKGNTSRQR